MIYNNFLEEKKLIELIDITNGIYYIGLTIKTGLSSDNCTLESLTSQSPRDQRPTLRNRPFLETCFFRKKKQCPVAATALVAVCMHSM